MNKSYIFYLIVGGIAIAIVGGTFDLQSLIWLGTVMMVGGSLFIPALDEANKPGPVKTKEKVVDVELIENGKKEINK